MYDVAGDAPRAAMGEDRAAYRREGGPGGPDKRGEAGAGATQSFQFVRTCLLSTAHSSGDVVQWLTHWVTSLFDLGSKLQT